MESVKTGNFYIYLVLVIIVVGGVLVLTFKNVFAGLSLSNELEQQIADIELRINKPVLNQAYDLYLNREISNFEFGAESSPASQLVQSENEQ